MDAAPLLARQATIQIEDPVAMTIFASALDLGRGAVAR